MSSVLVLEAKEASFVSFGGIQLIGDGAIYAKVFVSSFANS